MRKSKYRTCLQALLKNPIFVAEEARVLGLPSRMLAYFCKKGLMERLSRGVYRVKETELSIDFEWEDLAFTAISIPRGVICLISALCYYNLTDQIMREYWIAVPHASKSPKRPHTRIVRMRNISLGQTTVRIGGREIKMFDRERTIVDAFRYLSKEIAIKALQGYLRPTRQTKPDFKKLMAYAQALRVDIEPYILSLTT